MYLSILFFGGMFLGLYMLRQIELVCRLMGMNDQEAMLSVTIWIGLCFFFGVIAFAYRA
jgi:hypothetical protein